MTTAVATSRGPGPRLIAARVSFALERVADWLLQLVPGALTVFLSFNSGGRDADLIGLALAFLSVLLLVRTLLARHPFAGVSGPVAIAAGGLMVFTVWAWLSSAWSDAPARAMIESQRAAVYLLAFLLFGLFLGRRGGVTLLVRGIAIAVLVVCAAGLATRLYPDVFAVDPALSRARLAYPVGYWNSLGLLAAIGGLLLLHTACDERGHVIVRAVGAAGVPVAALTVFFTFSRGAAAAAALGVVAYLLVARPKGAVAGLIAAGLPTLLALRAAYGADLLASQDPFTAAAASQGHDLAAVLLACCAGAAVCLLLLAPLERRLRFVRVPQALPRSGWTSAAVLAVIGLGVAIALDAPDRVDRAWNSFTQPEQVSDSRTRFQDVTIGGRKDHWDVAMEYFRRHRVTGAGAGTFETQWLRSRPGPGAVENAHSLYIEVLSELGLVGFLALVTALSAILIGLLLRARGQARPLYGAAFAASLMWVAHAGVDWDWELLAVSVWFFALGGAALARSSRREEPPPVPSWLLRGVVAVACIVLAIGAVRTVVSDGALEDSIASFKAGDCRTAREAALTSLDAVDTQPQALAVLAYCDAEQGRYREAIEKMTAAARLDPQHWRYRYGLAIVRGMAGKDPRPELRAARRLDPLGLITTIGGAAQIQRSDGPNWAKLAAAAPRPIDE